MINILTINEIEHSFQKEISTQVQILSWISLILINASNGYLIHVIKNKMNSLLDWLILMDCILCIFNCITLIKHGIIGKSLENIPMCFFFNLNSYFINVSNKLVTIGISIYRYVFVVHYINMHKGPFTNYVIGIWGGGVSQSITGSLGGGGGVPQKNYELCYFPVKM